MPDFVPPTDTNDSADNICQRVAEIQCAGQAHCCTSAVTQNVQVADCITAQAKACVDSGLVDIAKNAVAGYDQNAATTRLAAFQTMASTCDPTIAAAAATSDGLRGVLQGTVAVGGDCHTVSTSATEVGAYLASCTDPKNNACLPSLPLKWKCEARSAQGGPCFTDVNCVENTDPLQGLYCANPPSAPGVGSGTCTPRKTSGSDCKSGTECQTLLCIASKCADATAENAYCITVSP
jgi:hypothetical protein